MRPSLSPSPSLSNSNPLSFFPLFPNSRTYPAYLTPISRLEWNSTGSRLASSSGTLLTFWTHDEVDKLLRQYDLKSGHECGIESIKWKDVNVVMTVSRDFWRIWDVREREGKVGREERREKGKGKTDFIAGEWMPGGQQFGVSLKNDNINFYDLRKQGILQTLKLSFEISKFKWDNTGSALLVATFSNSLASIQLHSSLPTYPLFSSYPCHSSPITSFQIDPTNSYLAIGSKDSCLNLYELQEMLCLRSYSGTDGCIKSLSFSPDGGLLAVGRDEGQMEIFQVGKGTVRMMEKNEIEGENGRGYGQVRWHPRKELLVAAEGGVEQGEILMLGRRL